jgi:hypothetical protein
MDILNTTGGFTIYGMDSFLAKANSSFLMSPKGKTMIKPLSALLFSLVLTSCSFVKKIDAYYIIPRMTDDSYKILKSHYSRGINIPDKISIKREKYQLFIDLDSQNITPTINVYLDKNSKLRIRITKINNCLKLYLPIYYSILDEIYGLEDFTLSYDQNCSSQLDRRFTIDIIDRENNNKINTESIYYDIERVGSHFIIDGI